MVEFGYREFLSDVKESKVVYGVIVKDEVNNNTKPVPQKL